jgi:hypothetical protein
MKLNLLKRVKVFSIILGYFFFFILCQQNFNNVRIPQNMPPYNPQVLESNSLQKWGYDTRYAAVKYMVENPEIRTVFDPGYGIIGNIKIAIVYPENLIQGAVEAIPFWLWVLLVYFFTKMINCLTPLKSRKLFWFIYPIMLFQCFLDIYLDYKDFAVPINEGWFYPLWIILFMPIGQLCYSEWRSVHIEKKTNVQGEKSM